MFTLRFNASPDEGRPERDFLSTLVRTAPQDQQGKKDEPNTVYPMSCIAPRRTAGLSQDEALLQASRLICMFCDKPNKDSNFNVLSASPERSGTFRLVEKVQSCPIQGRGRRRSHFCQVSIGGFKKRSHVANTKQCNDWPESARRLAMGAVRLEIRQTSASSKLPELIGRPHPVEALLQHPHLLMFKTALSGAGGRYTTPATATGLLASPNDGCVALVRGFEWRSIGSVLVLQPAPFRFNSRLVSLVWDAGFRRAHSLFPHSYKCGHLRATGESALVRA
eukprot:scaffold301_cov370-Pavlova_lutheri.AAC.22